MHMQNMFVVNYKRFNDIISKQNGETNQNFRIRKLYLLNISECKPESLPKQLFL